MARLLALGKHRTLTRRLVSAAVMLPLAAAAVWLGGWVFAAMISLAAGLMFWEWQGLCGEKDNLAYGLAALCALTALLWSWAGPWTSIVAGVSVGLVSNFGRHRVFRVAGFAYILLACISLIWLRARQPAGMETVIWLGLVVVMTDTCAYLTGKTVGGPKLAPKISPKKTWSGLLGGMTGAAIAGALVASAFNEAEILGLGLLGGVFAIIAQLGDLLVSKAKRAYGVKDSGNLIPGHGGVLDRLDGFLSSSLALTVLVLLAGRSPLEWP